MSHSRIGPCFARLQEQGRGGLITFLTAGDPDPDTSAHILARLPAAGADIIELGMPFSDPMADGPAIQASSLRALRGGQTLRRTLAMVADFRRGDARTPIVLMGYYNPIYVYGVDAFVRDASAAGADGVIIVDLPPEEADEFLEPAQQAGLDLVFLTAPTTDETRLPLVLRHAAGFLYHVSITGITGTASATTADVEAAVDRLRSATALPIAIGFGIKTPAQAAAMARIGDAAVVGSALVSEIAAHLDPDGRTAPGLVEHVVGFVADLAAAVRGSI